MDFFELRAAMVSGRKVMAKRIEPTYEQIVAGVVAEVGYKLDRDKKEMGYCGILERGKNTLHYFPMKEVEPVYAE